jgi:hypothetical protein
MDWGFFTTPAGTAIIATVGSFFAGLIGVAITTRTMRVTSSARLATDKELADQKFESDRELSTKKADADIALAREKFQLDARLADRKRRQDLAEEVLESFYKVRDAIRAVRVLVTYEDEAASRKTTEPESPEVARRRNTYFVPLARLDANRADIAVLLAKRYRTSAWFGATAEEPFQEFHEILTEIATSAQMLMRNAHGNLDRTDRDFWLQMEGNIWAGAVKPDPIAERVNTAIAKIEAICRPAIEGKSA